MKRYYFIDDDLEDLALIERELESRNVVKPQVHVLSRDDAGVQGHGLNEVHSLLKKDIIRAGEIGGLIGLVVSLLSIAIAYFSGLAELIGWVPFIFLSIVLLGFFTWEGGLFGIQEPNRRFRQFEAALKAGNHVFLVDVEPKQEAVLRDIMAAHPQLKPAGVGESAPRWVIGAQQKWREFLNWAP